MNDWINALKEVCNIESEFELKSSIYVFEVIKSFILCIHN